MAITLADFNKIWASTSPLTPYSFSEANYKQGWNFIGATPPVRQMWDFLQKNNDEKMQYLANNYLPLTGGTLTGALTLADGGTALSNATVGKIVSNAISSSVSLDEATAKTLTSITLDAGVWIVRGKAVYSPPMADKVYGIEIGTIEDHFSFSNSGSNSVHSSSAVNLCVESVMTFKLSTTTTMYINGYSNVASTATCAGIWATRIA